MSAGFTLSDAVEWTGGERLRGSAETELVGVSIDTRTVSAGELFVAIAGPNFDAHDFLADAVGRGAAGLLIERGRELDPRLPANLPVVAVDDTTAGLGAVAAGHRARFHGPVVAITGSNGKTTTKEMCASILAVDGPCLKTRGNLNNQYGLPLTLLRRRQEDLSAVVELGTNHPGEIAYLAALSRPDVALVTNIGTAHIEHLGSRAGIAEEKGALFAALDGEAIAVVNTDEPLLVEQARRTRCAQITYGREGLPDVRAERIAFVDGKGFEFHLLTPHGEAAIEVAGIGDTTVINALAAAAATISAGAPVENVRVGLAQYEPIRGRMSQIRVAREITIIDDSYNANPQSMRSALESLSRLKGGDRAVAVLGDMGELGESEEKAHRDAGHLAASLGIDALFAIGGRALDVTEAAMEAGMESSRVHVATDHDDATKQIRSILEPRDWVLVKGSRSMKMERIVDALVAEEGR